MRLRPKIYGDFTYYFVRLDARRFHVMKYAKREQAVSYVTSISRCTCIAGSFNKPCKHSAWVREIRRDLGEL